MFTSAKLRRQSGSKRKYKILVKINDFGLGGAGFLAIGYVLVD